MEREQPDKRVTVEGSVDIGEADSTTATGVSIGTVDRSVEAPVETNAPIEGSAVLGSNAGNVANTNAAGGAGGAVYVNIGAAAAAAQLEPPPSVPRALQDVWKQVASTNFRVDDLAALIAQEREHEREQRVHERDERVSRQLHLDAQITLIHQQVERVSTEVITNRRTTGRILWFLAVASVFALVLSFGAFVLAEGLVR